MPEPVEPQYEILDDFLWNRLSSFWSAYYNQEDKEAVSAVFEAVLKALDAEYVRLYQIDQSKSLKDHPLFTQRRWVRLDMYRYAELRAWLQYLRRRVLSTGGEPGEDNETSGTDQLTCIPGEDPHARHWHLHFPFRIQDTRPEGRTINLGFPIDESLVAIWRIRNPDRDNPMLHGGRLTHGEYSIVGGGTAVRIENGALNELFELDVAVNLTAEDVTPDCVIRTSFLSGNEVQIPDEFHGWPVHALVVRNAPEEALAGAPAQRTNNGEFTTERVFIPWGDPQDPVQPGCLSEMAGRLTLPSGMGLQKGRDVVFVFGVRPGKYNAVHRHRRHYSTLNRSNASPDGTRVWDPQVAPGLGMFGSADFLANEIKVFLNGRLLPPTQYQYDAVDHKVTFRTPVTFGSYDQVPIEIHYHQEYVTERMMRGDLHNHFLCYGHLVVTEREWERFDDGGNFDDDGPHVGSPPESDHTAIFDDMASTNLLYLPAVVDKETLQIYVGRGATGGLRLLQPGRDYRATILDGVTRLYFLFPIDGKDVLVTYREESAVFVYGLDDLVGGPAGLSGLTGGILEDMLQDNMAGLMRGFEDYYGTVSDWASLQDAAWILAGGGNPILTLFFDEFPEYENYNINSPQVPLITAAQARNIESANTRLMAIPFMTDHVVHATERIASEVEYAVENGHILSFSRDLAGPKYEGDPAPGVWWCPLIVLDEHFLSKTFGFLVGDMRDTSRQYLAALTANILLRYSGPTVAALHNATCALLGSGVFTQDGIITEASRVPVNKLVTVRAGAGGAEASFSFPPTSRTPDVGTPIFAGQSLGDALVFSRKTVPQFVSWSGSALTLDRDMIVVRPGDVMHLTFMSKGNPDARLPVRLRIKHVGTQPILGGTRSVLMTEETVRLEVAPDSPIYIFRDFGPPYAPFPGVVSAVEIQQQIRYRTDQGEEFLLPPGAAKRYREGDRVYRGWATQPDLARVYDHQIRPNWYRMYPEDLRRLWEGSAPDLRPIPQRRLVTIEPGDKGYARAALSPAYPIPVRGTKALFTPEDNRQSGSEFLVGGSDGNVTLLYPNVDGRISGEVRFEAPDPLSTQAERFEQPCNQPLPNAFLRLDAQYGAPALFLEAVPAFTNGGRAVLHTPDGGRLWFSFGSLDTSDRAMREITWDPEPRALQDAQGVLHPHIAAGWVVQQVTQFRPYLLNPAFLQAVDQRVVRDTSMPFGGVNITVENASQYYELLQGTTHIIETSDVQPTPLRHALHDISPAFASTIVQSRHIFFDTYVGTAEDRAVRDSVRQYYPLQVSVALPEGSQQPDAANTWRVPKETVETTIQADVGDVNPGGGPITYAWQIFPAFTPRVRPAVSHPDRISTQLTGLEEMGRYRIRLDVHNNLGITAHLVITLLVDS